MAKAYHSQQSFIGGIRQTGSEASENYFVSLTECNNFLIDTGGSIRRRKGTDVDRTFTELSSVNKMFKLGDGYVYLTTDNLLKGVYGGESFVIPLIDFSARKYTKEGVFSGEEVLRLNRLVNPLSNIDLTRTAINISIHNDGLYVVGSKQSRFIISLDNDLIYVRPPYFDRVDRVNGFLRSVFFPTGQGYNKLPNPFFVDNTTSLSSVANRIELVIGADSDLNSGLCNMWLNVNDLQSLDNNVRVKPSVVGLQDFIGTPFIFNVIPTQIPILSTANDYSVDTVYSNYPTLQNLNNQINLNLETDISNANKVNVLAGLLFQRKYMAIPYEYVNTTGSEENQTRNLVYNDSTTSVSAVTIADVNLEILDSNEFEYTVEPEEDDMDTEEEDLERTELINLVIGYNSDDGLVSSFERTQPYNASYTGQVRTGGNFSPAQSVMPAFGLRVNNNIATEDIERTPFIILSNFSNLAQNVVSTSANGGAYELDIRRDSSSAWTTHTLDRAAIIPGIGIEFSANPNTSYNEADFIGNFQIRLRYIANKQSRSGNYVQWTPAQSLPQSSNVYAKCVLIELGVPSPYTNDNRYTSGTEVNQNLIRRIGGNNYDGGVSKGSNVLIGLQDEFTSVTSLGVGAGIGTQNSVFMELGENNGESNNILGYLNNQFSEDFSRLSTTTGVALSGSVVGSAINNFLAQRIPTTFPNGFLFNPAIGFVRDLYTGRYRGLDLRNEYNVLSNDTTVEIQDVYASFDRNTVVVKTKGGLYEVAFDQPNASLRSREQTKGDVVLFLGKSVSMTTDDHIAVSSFTFERLGYKTKIFGRVQRELLSNLTSIAYSLRDRRFMVTKEDGSLVSFTQVTDDIIGFNQVNLKGFNCEYVFTSNDDFHFYGHFDDEEEKRILILGGDDFVDYRNLEDKKTNVESELITNSIAFGETIGVTGRLKRTRPMHIRFFQKNAGDYKYGVSGEHQRQLTYQRRSQNVDNLDNDIEQNQFSLVGFAPKDYETKLHFIQDDETSGGILYGFQIEGEID